MRTVRLLQPSRIVFGSGCSTSCVDELVASRRSRVLIITSSAILELVAPFVAGLKQAEIAVSVYAEVDQEPALVLFAEAREAARAYAPDAIIGIGGGSAMDVAKLVAALHDSDQAVSATFGIDQLGPRRTYLACLPTTAGTGSEVSPNAILSDPEQQAKRGIISPHLVPDAAYIDPDLTLGLPPALTAATGLDALTHCIEAYANRYAHPLVDVYALAGIRLIGENLVKATRDGSDTEARTAMAMGSLYGGLCLSPVNTAAVHALAYPLGGELHIPHGISNAVLLPHVLQFNLPDAPDRYAAIAEALGVQPRESDSTTALAGLERLQILCQQCAIPMTLSELGIPAEAIPGLAVSAMQVTRLLKNNVRDLTLADAEAIYRSAWA
jgi:alcohol dehydrogenase